MNHPEGRLIAIQQQIHFAKILSDAMGIDTELVLTKIASVGLKLTTDENEIALDSAQILPNLLATKAGLRLV